MGLAPLTETQDSLPKALRPIWELLRQQSIGAINEGLEAFSALCKADSVISDRILDTTGVFPRPGSRSAIARLQPGSRFTRADEDSNPYLIYALMGVLSRSSKSSRGAELRQAIQCLDIQCPGVPEVVGFTGLMELRLSLVEPKGCENAGDSCRLAGQFGQLPLLEKLELITSNQSVKSIDLMPAPKLKTLVASGIGLHSVEGLAEIHNLVNVDLSCNPQLKDLSPLSVSSASIRRLSLCGTGINGLEDIQGLKELDLLNINECERVVSLDSLSHLTITQREFELRLPNLNQLKPMPTLTGNGLSLAQVRVTSLDGIEDARNVDALALSDMNLLSDISAVKRLVSLRRFSIADCDEITTLQTLQHTHELVDVHVGSCRKLSVLPATWPLTLRSLKISGCPIEELGQIPGDFAGELDLSECNMLKSLNGLSGCTRITVVRVDCQPRDFSVLATLPDIWLCLDYKNHPLEPSDQLIESLKALTRLNLKIVGSRRMSRLAPLSCLGGLSSLDISELHVEDIDFILGLERLEVLKIPPRTKLSKRLGGCTFDSAMDIAKLKLLLLASA